MNNALLYFGGLLVVILTALFAVPLFIDWNGYRGMFEEEASKVLGRDVRVGGEVNVRFLPTPYVRFEKVRLADPTGHTGESFVRAESFTMWLSGPALLRGVLEANMVELNKPVLTLALDGKGSGNWASLRLKPAALPFVPKDVTLNSVRLIDGALALYNSTAEPIGRIEDINGELAAEALDGPFKFKGTVLWSGEYREIKLVTDKPDSDGSFRIKANARALKAINSYTLDGKIESLSSAPKFTGELTAKLPAPAGDDAAVKDKGEQHSGVDFKSAVTADAMSARFDNISLSLENAAEQQLVTGTATSNWAAAPRLDVALTSKWLDLDRIAAPGQEIATFPKLKQMTAALMRSFSGEGAAAVQLAVDQIKMGGETAGGLRLDMERSGSDVRIRRFSTGLPGGARLALNGDVKDEAGKVTFRGSGSAHGTNASRLLAWAAKSGTELDIKAEGPFSADGALIISENHFELKDAAAEFNGRPVTGELVMSDEGRRLISVALESSRLDTSLFFPGTAQEIETQIRQLFGLVPKSDTAPATQASAQSDIELRLLTAELKHGEQIYRNVDARLSLDAGNITIKRADFTTPAGLSVGIEGKLAKGQASGHGTIAYELAAKTPEAAQDAVTIFGLSNIMSAARVSAFGPGQIAGLVHIGKGNETSADITVEGTLNGAQVSGQAIFDNGFGSWRTAPGSTTFKLKAQDPGVITGLIGLPLKSADPDARPTEVVVASSGPLATGSAALVIVKSQGLDATFNGRAVWPESGTIAFAGPIDVKARDMQELLALAGYKLPGGVAGTPVEGQIEVAGEQSTWTFSSRQLVLGNSTVSGSLSLKPAGEQLTSVSGDIAADRVTIAALLSSLLDKPPVAADPVADPAVTAASIWPESVFNFTSLKGIEGGVDVHFGVFDVSGALSVHDGAMKFAVAPGSVTLSSITGQAAGGNVDASAKLESVAGGVNLQTALKITKADLAMLAGKASGHASLDVAASGKAQSPAGLIAALTGTGVIDLDGARIIGPMPQTVSAAANQVLQNKATSDPDAIQSAIETSLATSHAVLGTRKVALTLADGAVKVEPIAIETPEGRARLTTTADLMSMRLDGQWQVSGVVAPLPPLKDVGADYVPPPPKGPLPPAVIVYTGRFDDLKTLSANVDTSELQRELTVRQMERNVEELERLRKRDEELARRETERRKAIEAEKAAAAAAAKARAQSLADPVQQPLPPILPQSNGAEGPAVPGQAQSVPAVSPQPANGQTAPTTTTGPVTVVPLTVEPIDPSSTSPATAEMAPQRTSPAVQRQLPPRPARPAQPHRTTADEVMRSLGGVP